MSILQPFKMAWRSIVGKKGCSTLTILSIFIGIAAVMTIVSVMEGMKLQVMKQFNAMGANRIEVQIEVYSSDESGNSAGVDYFPKLYSYCQGLACFFGYPDMMRVCGMVSGKSLSTGVFWQSFRRTLS